ncbi:MAG TPA: carboxypeptidase regulatory-like domain-containing protein [Pyrinomonadaceae bacterium]|nr:carboxypeptidase regulatory-like domain-containing protein [Pyrinomonadaceae bacterium]
MKRFTQALCGIALFIAAAISIQAQVAGAIGGTVTDQNGAVIPGATISVKGTAGQNFSATSNSDGGYNIPAVPAGFYTVTVSAANFKTSVVQNVKVDVATPATVNAALTAGRIDEQVIVTGGAEVLQTATPTIGTNIQGRQILETPIQSRDALDLVTLLPGTSSVGVVRTSTINGLPKSALTIQIDGVDVQDNFLKSSDGFFTFIRPRIDAIDEVTVSTSNPGSEAAGDGAVGIRFVTRRGTDDYRGSVFWQHRDESMNGTNFQNNYLAQNKSKLRLNQFGGSFGGPLPFLQFGEGVKPFTDGKGKHYFFVNYERFHLNENSPVRTRAVLTQEAQNGIFRYGANGASTVNLFTIAGGAGLPTTIDPTVAGMLNAIRAAAGTTGSFNALGTGSLTAGSYYRQTYNFVNSGEQRRRFLVTRFDVNVTKNHSIDVIYNDQPFRSNVDFLNSVDPAFPGLDNAGTQNSDRRSLSIGVRSTFGSNIVNEFRYAQLGGWLGGSSDFFLVGGEDFFNNLMRGYAVSIAAAGVTNPTIRNAFSSRSSPTRDFTNNVTWIKGDHTLTFGGQLKRVETISDATNLYKSTITLGVATGDPLIAAFTTTSIPGANATEVAAAQGVYAVLAGRVSGFGSNAVLGADQRYALNGPRQFQIREETNGLFAQDSWRIRNNFTLTFGLRWQPQIGAKMMSANYAILSDPNMVYDVSGPGNFFSAGNANPALRPTYRGNTIGEKAFRDDLNNFAPSVGAVWSPDFGDGIFSKILGRNGKAVFRGGFSRAFIREGTLIVENSVGQNPGGAFANNRSTAIGNLTVGTNFRDAGNPNITAPTFNPVPSYPRAITTGSDAALGFAPDFRSGYVDSWSFGYQREIDRNTVVEFRYVGNRGKEMQNQYNLNEVNAIENGFGAEFAIAQRNLLANIAAGPGAGCIGGVTTAGCQFNFALTAAPGTAPLPIIVSYLQAGNPNANLPASYGANFASSTFYNLLAPSSPNVLGFAQTMANNATFRANGTAAGRSLNFLQNCPSSIGNCFYFDNTEKSWYDSAVVEVRRRLSDGLRFQASYVWAKAFSNAFASAGTAFFGLGAGDQSNASNVTLRNRGLDKTFAQIDVRHSFKFDATWDLPFGKGRQFAKNSNAFVDAIIGGWTITPTVRWQSGSPVLMENIQLVGMTGEELQKLVGVYYNQTITQPNGSTSVANVTYLPGDVISQTIRAFTTTGTTASGYLAGQAPSGRFIAPAGYNNCQQRALGQCGYRKFVLFGPNFFKMDASIGKRIKIGEKRNVEMRATMFDVLNRTNWRLGGWTGNVNNITAFTGTFGQMAQGWAFTDPNGSNDPGGRIVDFLVRLNF